MDESPTCDYKRSEEVVEELLRQVTKERNRESKIRVPRSGSLDVCAFDPNMMICPEGRHMKVTQADVPQIVEQYLNFEPAEQTQEAAPAAK